MFPNAKIRNIYASTEAGSLFASDGEYFTIPDRYREKIKIQNNEIIIHHLMLGESDNYSLIEDWYHSGDMVEIIETDPYVKFRFKSRKNQMINVGGYKVNPEEVEEALLKISNIKAVRVYGKASRVLGNILCADIISDKLSEKEIRQSLDLQSFKIPRIINFKDKIDLTRSGKVMR
jgi:acyl-coenzyme A synthetase/AMP-(fatty) acid ligase